MQSGAAVETFVAAVPATHPKFPSHAPDEHGVPAGAGRHAPVDGTHALETHSAPPQSGVPTHTPPEQTGSVEKTHRSVPPHDVPSAAFAWTHDPPLHESLVHPFASLQSASVVHSGGGGGGPASTGGGGGGGPASTGGGG